MKGLIVLVCALVAVQARSATVSQRSTEAALGENPWLVHLRLAVSTSGLLETCAGTLIDQSWILTAASCLTDNRFIWSRYGAVNVINPSLVTENSLVRVHPDFDGVKNNIALININRVVQSTANIGPIALASEAVTPESAKFCTFNEAQSDVPGEILRCLDIVVKEEDGVIASDAEVSKFDIGAPLVKDSVQIGVLVDTEGTFLPVAEYLEWIEEETELDFSSRVPAVVGNDQGIKVNFVN